MTSGQTATIGVWQNKNGHELIESLNGRPDSTQLSSRFAATFDNMHGADAGANDLTGMTNTTVADFYSDLFRRNKKEAQQLGLGGPVKMDSQVMAVALATYVTNSNLADFAAVEYGFLVTEDGVGTSTFDVGDAFDVSDNTQMAVASHAAAKDFGELQAVCFFPRDRCSVINFLRRCGLSNSADTKDLLLASGLSPMRLRVTETTKTSCNSANKCRSRVDSQRLAHSSLSDRAEDPNAE